MTKHTLRYAFEHLWATLHDIACTNVMTLEEVQQYAREELEDFPHAKKYDGELNPYAQAAQAGGAKIKWAP